jgi:hypothetical protein
MMTATKPPRPPAGLDDAGRRLWRSIAGRYELRPDELTVLESACRTADDEDRLTAALADEPTVVAGSMGQRRASPLFAEVRAARALLAALLARLALPDDQTDSRAAKLARSQQGRNAAAVRWGHRGAS